MLDEIFYYFVRLYLPAIIFGIAGGFLVLSYLKMKKKTHLIMGVGFLYLALGTVIVYLLQQSVYSEYGITYSFLGIRWISPYVWYSLFYSILIVVPALLILLGIIRFYRESARKVA
jgi:drug/metabolite transporter superfamily protein YnfA